MSVTIRDVAKASGVSTSTVSRALANPEMVDPTTRQRVVLMADSLGYRPNRAARALITGRTGNLGLVLPDLANPFFPCIIKAIQTRASSCDMQVVIADTDEVPEAELDTVRSLAKQVDGVILCSPRMSTAQLHEAARYVPMVLANRRSGSIPSVTVDSPGVMRSAVAHLVDLGHRTIGYLGGPQSSWSSRERLGSMQAATAEHGVRFIELGHFAPNFQGGRDACDGVLAHGVTAVIGYNDLCAVGLISALRERGVHVPGDLSVVGIDDIELAAMVHPALTTVGLPKTELGHSAVDLMMRTLADSDRAPEHICLDTRLIMRATTTSPTAHPPVPR